MTQDGYMTHDEYAEIHKPLAPCRPEHMQTAYYCSNCGFNMPTCRGMREDRNFDSLSEPTATEPAEPSTYIGDEELRDLLTARAARTLAKDQERLKKEADLHRAVVAKLQDDATKS